MERPQNRENYSLSTEGKMSSDRLRLLAFFLRDATGHLYSTESVYVLRNAAIERLGNALAVLGRLQPGFVGRIANERNFRQDRRHVRANQDDEGGLLYTAVAQART